MPESSQFPLSIIALNLFSLFITICILILSVQDSGILSVSNNKRPCLLLNGPDTTQVMLESTTCRHHPRIPRCHTGAGLSASWRCSCYIIRIHVVGVLSLPLMARRIHSNGHDSFGETKRNPTIRSSYHCSTAHVVSPKASDDAWSSGMCHLGGPCNQRHHSVESCKVWSTQRTDDLNLCVLVDRKWSSNKTNVDQSENIMALLAGWSIDSFLLKILRVVNAAWGQLDQPSFKLQVWPSWMNRLSFNTRYITCLVNFTVRGTKYQRFFLPMSFFSLLLWTTFQD